MHACMHVERYFFFHGAVRLLEKTMGVMYMNVTIVSGIHSVLDVAGGQPTKPATIELVTHSTANIAEQSRERERVPFSHIFKEGKYVCQ